MNSSMSRKIRIVSLFPGDAPEWVRKEWIGLELTVSERQIPERARVVSALRKPLSDDQNNYLIEPEELLSKLRQKSPSAEQWYQDNVINPKSAHILLGALLTQGNILGFVIGKEFCEVIET